jgi:UDP-N-acetylglucosamine 2-epimerase (non-hydrolysing)
MSQFGVIPNFHRPYLHRLVYTGQHYDSQLAGSFFEQLGIPEPDENLEAGFGAQAMQAAAIMVRYERQLLEALSRLCLVVGDVTSTMACAIVAQKLAIPVACVEGDIPTLWDGRTGERNHSIVPAGFNR